MRPLVSVILVNYNGFEDTIECVKSLKDIDYDNYEIIVVDNGSTVNPTDQQSRYLSENTIFIRNDKNLGFAGGNNIGIKTVLQHNPQYLLLLNNDTVVKKDFLTRLVETAESHSNVGIVCGKIYWFDEPDTLWFDGGEIDRNTCITTHYNYNKKDTHMDNQQTREISFATGCMWLVPSETIQTVGMMDEDYFLYSEDDDYCCRITDAGYKIIYNPAVSIYHKVSKSSGGSMNASVQYYIARNKLMIIEKYSKNKVKSYYCYSKNYIKKFLHGEIDLNVVVEAIIAAKRGVIGKRPD